MSWAIHQYRDHRGRAPVQEWYESLIEREQAKFDERLRALRQNGPEEFRSDWCGPIRKGIWKLKLKGNKGARQHRVMLCKGPVKMDSELTLLFPAEEKDRKLIPADAVDRAIERMHDIAFDPNGRRQPWKKL